MKKCVLVLLRAPNLAALVSAPELTAVVIADRLRSWGPDGQEWFYQYDLQGFFDGAIWCLLKARDTNGQIRYANKSSWSIFARAMIKEGLAAVLGSNPLLPKFDPPETVGLWPPAPFTLARNIRRISDLIYRPETLVEVGGLLDDQSRWWLRGEEQFPRVKKGDEEWGEFLAGKLSESADLFAVCLTVLFGKKPHIPDHYVPCDFVAPEEERY